MKTGSKSRLDDMPAGSESHGLRAKTRSTDKYVSSIWSFPGSGGDQLYRWYGTLPRPLIERLFEQYGSGAARFADPFLGTATTLDVAADMSLCAIGMDTNPLACLIAETRLFGVDQDSSVLSSVERLAHEVQMSSSHAGYDADFSGIAASDEYAYTRKWFRKDTLRSLLTLLSHISDVSSVQQQRVFLVAFSQIVRDVASVDPRCTHHLVTKEKPFIDPIPLWKENVARILRSKRKVPADAAKVSVQQGSILDSVPAVGRADFAILHPPYLGVIHYHLIHRLATDLLDIANKTRNLDALAKYDFNYSRLRSADMSTDRTDRYSEFVGQVAQQMSKMISPDGRCAVIIGDQRHKGNIRHPFTDFIAQFEANGFALEENFIWILQNNGGMHVLRRGHFIDHNYILVFHNQHAGNTHLSP